MDIKTTSVFPKVVGICVKNECLDPYEFLLIESEIWFCYVNKILWDTYRHIRSLRETGTKEIFQGKIENISFNNKECSIFSKEF